VSKEYTVVRHNDQIVLVMNLGTAALVQNSLEIINPDETENETLARNLALDLEGILDD
jgi:hypothetical protein